MTGDWCVLKFFQRSVEGAWDKALQNHRQKKIRLDFSRSLVSAAGNRA